MGTTPKQELEEARSTWRYSCWWSTPAEVYSSCSPRGLGSLERIHGVGHNSQAKCKTRPSSPISYHGDARNCVYGKVLESHGGISGGLRQYTEYGESHDNTQRLPKPFLVPSVLFCQSWNHGGIQLCAHLTVHSWKRTYLAISRFPNTATGK